MKILIFGATGATGQCLVEQALELGYEVTAFARNPSAITYEHPLLKVVRGDVLEPALVNTAMAGQDAVLCALGVQSFSDTNVLSTGMKNIIAAMEKSGTRRIVCESSLGVGDSRQQTGFIFGKIIVPLVFKGLFKDKERQENLLCQSQLDWVIVRPARLTNGPGKGVYKAVVDRSKAGSQISRADVAAFMLEQLKCEKYLKQKVVIAD
ncbi:MAG: SDR family oxidoreductase [Chroococcidiopsidaceae cyanobacterium CP_BM_ER_R8_30]|nr:SDR family oxidoreductase [Chroococcidiopsidaceae cyanobacterium CP_BM_ER_R8_30]